MYVNVSAVVIATVLILAFFVLMGALAMNAWTDAEGSVRHWLREREWTIAERKRLSDAASRQERAAMKLETDRARSIREARDGFEMDVANHRPLTLDEMYEHLDRLPSPREAQGNTLFVHVVEQPFYGTFSPRGPSGAIQQIGLTRVRFATRKPEYDPRAFPHGLPGGIDAVPQGTTGAAAYREEAVWMFDGKIIVSPLYSITPALRVSGRLFGPRLRAILRGYYGEHLEAIDDRELESAVMEGLSRLMMERRYFRASH